MKIKIFLATFAIIALVAGALVTGQAMANQDDEKAQLGVYLSESDQEGALINSVISGSAADDAGIKSGDLILAVDGKTITSPDGLVELIKTKKPGDNISIRLLRKGSEQTLNATLKESRDFVVSYFGKNGEGKNWISATRPEMGNVLKSFGKKAYLGVYHGELTEGLGNYFGVKDGKGVLVSDVLEDSPAEKAGLKPGDVIVGINGKAVTSFDDLEKALYFGDEEKEDHQDETKPEEKTVDVEIKVIRNKSEKTFTVNAEIQNGHFFFRDGYQKGYIDAIKSFQLQKGKMKDLDFYFHSPDHKGLVLKGDKLNGKAIKIAPRVHFNEGGIRILENELNGLEHIIDLKGPHSYFMSLDIDDEENVNINFNGKEFDSIDKLKSYLESDEFKQTVKDKKEKIEKRIKAIKKANSTKA